MATITYSTFEFSVSALNAYTTGMQQYPDVLGLTNGGYVAAYNNGGDFLGLNFYDAAGSIVGTTQVPVNDAFTAPQGQPSLTQLADGNVVVVWKEHQSGSTGVRAAIFTPTGSTVQNNLLIDNYSGDFFGTPTVTTLSNGNFVVAVDDGSNIFFAITNPAGVTVKSYSIANTTTSGIQNDAQITALAGGGFVVTWTDTNPADQQIRGRIYDASGVATTGSDFLIAAFGDNTQSSVAKLKDGGFVVAYTDSGWADSGGVLGNGISLQYMNADGSFGALLEVNDVSSRDEVEPDVTVLDNGYVLVTWTFPFSTLDNDIHAALFTASGTRLQVSGSNEFVLNGSGDNEIHGAVSAVSGGRFILAIEDTTSTDITGIYTQMVRTTTGDATNENLKGDELRDIIHAGDGNDILNGLGNINFLYGEGGNDLLVVSVAETGSGSVFDGGSGTDTLYVGSSLGTTYDYDFRDDTVSSIEQLVFIDPSLGGSSTVRLSASQFGGGISLSAIITGGDSDSVPNTLDVTMGSATTLDLSGLTFVSFDGPADSVTIHGDGDAETIIGSQVKDVIHGGGGSDYLDGKGGLDMLYGDAGDDTFVVNSPSDQVIELAGEGNDTVLAAISYVLVSGTEVENLATTSAIGAADINLTGNEIAQTITGNAGNNVINGGGGVDTMIGGLGNDTYIIDNASDVVTEFDSQGNDSIVTAVSYVLGAGVSVENLATDAAAGTANVNLVGNEFSQSLTGNAGANVLNGAGGSDVMAGGLGNDSYVVDNAGDVIIESDGQGADTVMTSVSYVLGAGASVESLTVDSTGGAAAFNLTGNEFSQSILGNKGVNKLSGLGGADTLYGFAGKDVLSGGSGNDILVGGAQADKLLGGSGTDTASYAGATKGVIANLASTAKNTGDAKGDSYSSIENLTGSSKDDTLIGNKLANTLSGSAGNDKLYGGLGKDILFGGGGKDTFVFDTKLGGSNVDKIGDFLAKSDTVFLNKDIFTEAGGPGQISGSFFHIGKTAEDQDDRIIYDKASGKLWYDADGTGSDAAVQFATMGKGLALTAADFVIIS